MVAWKISDNLQDYVAAVATMEARVADIRAGTASELVWLLEHPALYTAGSSAKATDLLEARFPVHQTGRGGQYTYHGPGQRIAYVMLDLQARKLDVRRFVYLLEEWLIQTLAEFEVIGERRQGRIGIWTVDERGTENKIAAIGLRVRRGVSFHGVALNVNPDLSHYTGIIPCGLSGYGVTSLHALGKQVNMDEVDIVLQKKWDFIFGASV